MRYCLLLLLLNLSLLYGQHSVESLSTKADQVLKIFTDNNNLMSVLQWAEKKQHTVNQYAKSVEELQEKRLKVLLQYFEQKTKVTTSDLAFYHYYNIFLRYSTANIQQSLKQITSSINDVKNSLDKKHYFKDYLRQKRDRIQDQQSEVEELEKMYQKKQDEVIQLTDQIATIAKEIEQLEKWEARYKILANTEKDIIDAVVFKYNGNNISLSVGSDDGVISGQIFYIYPASIKQYAMATVTTTKDNFYIATLAKNQKLNRFTIAYPVFRNSSVSWPLSIHSIKNNIIKLPITEHNPIIAKGTTLQLFSQPPKTSAVVSITELKYDVCKAKIIRGTLTAPINKSDRATTHLYK